MFQFVFKYMVTITLTILMVFSNTGLSHAKTNETFVLPCNRFMNLSIAGINVSSCKKVQESQVVYFVQAAQVSQLASLAGYTIAFEVAGGTVVGYASLVYMNDIATPTTIRDVAAWLAAQYVQAAVAAPAPAQGQSGYNHAAEQRKSVLTVQLIEEAVRAAAQNGTAQVFACTTCAYPKLAYVVSGIDSSNPNKVAVGIYVGGGLDGNGVPTMPGNSVSFFVKESVQALRMSGCFAWSIPSMAYEPVYEAKGTVTGAQGTCRRNGN